MVEKREQLGQRRDKARSFKERFINGLKKASRGKIFDHDKMRKVRRDNRIRKSFMSAVRNIGTNGFKKEAKNFSMVLAKRAVNFGKGLANASSELLFSALEPDQNYGKLDAETIKMISEDHKRRAAASKDYPTEYMKRIGGAKR